MGYPFSYSLLTLIGLFLFIASGAFLVGFAPKAKKTSVESMAWAFLFLSIMIIAILMIFVGINHSNGMMFQPFGMFPR